jgi:glutamyl-tRNA(Gln) amidotransferase, subunit D
VRKAFSGFQLFVRLNLKALTRVWLFNPRKRFGIFITWHSDIFIMSSHTSLQDVEVGDIVEVQFDGDKIIGRVMPRTELDPPGLLTLKLSNGYNVGVSLKGVSLKVLKKSEQKHKPIQESEEEEKYSAGEFVSLISTGGTIASRVEYETGAVKPALYAKDLLTLVPELASITKVKTRILMSILSEDMKPSYWTEIAKAVYEEIKSGACGVVVAHGTDTMGYTAAALSFALPKLSVPVVLVGAQRSSDRPSSDAYFNLINAVKFARFADASGVFVCMHSSTSDPTSWILTGTKVRKMHTSARYAFKPINARAVALVNGDIKMLERTKPRGGETVLKAGFSEKCSLIYSYPGLSQRVLEALCADCEGVVFAGTGLGHVPSYLLDSISQLKKRGVLFFMTSQCYFGRVNMNVYTTGRRLLSAGVVPLEDMLPETAYVKLCWCVANFPREKVEEVMRTNLVGEISERTVYEVESYESGLRSAPAA